MDDRISVAAVFRNGLVKIYDQPDRTKGGIRPLLGKKRFPTYGAALLWAMKFEDEQRKAITRAIV